MSELSQILAKLTDGSLSESASKQLETWVLSDSLRAKAFGIDGENVSQVVKERSHLFQTIYPDILDFCQKTGIELNSSILETLWDLWIPLAIQLANYRQEIQRPLIQGILGGQGTGKTTLAAVLILILKHLGYQTISISLDDLYKTYAERKVLREQDPRLIWRGPPGTHDIELGIKVLDQLRGVNLDWEVAGKNLEALPQNQKSKIQNPKSKIPRFDKSAWNGEGDRTAPEIVENVDIVLFEGWFVGVRPIDPSAFDNAPPPILTAEDRKFAHDMNVKLQDYLPLWEQLDRLILLDSNDYRLSQEWRKQAEHKMTATGKSGMSDKTVDRFVEYFWKSLHPELFVKPMKQDSKWVHLAIEINPDRSVGLVYKPSDRLP
jgi:D-glycerate 3-kinase